MFKKILLINHATSKSGSANYLEDYLLREKYTVWRITHPLDFYQNGQTFLLKNKKKIVNKKRSGSASVNLVIDLYLSLKFLRDIKFDTFIGANNFDTFTGIIARKVFRKKIKEIVYFASDFSEKRYGNIFLNFVYYLIERIALKYSDKVISNTNRAEKKRFGMGLKKSKSIVIQNGIFINNPAFNKKEILKNNFIYIGSLTPEHGIYKLLEEIAPIIKKLVIIGHGDEQQKIIDLCQKYNINLELHQHKSHEYVIDYLKEFNGFGLAPYNLEAGWTYYCSPTKIGEYIGTVVPVLISNVPEMAEYIADNSLGIVYNNLNIKEIENKLNKFDLLDFEKKSELYYRNFNRNKLYEKL